VGDGMPSVSFPVRGHKPIAWGNNEWDWRRAVADQARGLRYKVDAHDVSERTSFIVEIVFLLCPHSIKEVDIDNLAKPVLDTIFKSRHPQIQDRYLTGALFDVDDDQVIRLVLEKREVTRTGEEGIDVTITWD
jgi:Holliday junction resolvase RusA-like endonuclease